VKEHENCQNDSRTASVPCILTGAATPADGVRQDAVRRDDAPEAEPMKSRFCILMILLLAIVGAASAADNTTEAQIAITGITVNPDTLMRGDTGTVTVEIKNTGSSSVAITGRALFQWNYRRQR
jgi:hypothetical protein